MTEKLWPSLWISSANELGEVLGNARNLLKIVDVSEKLVRHASRSDNGACQLSGNRRNRVGVAAGVDGLG